MSSKERLELLKRVRTAREVIQELRRIEPHNFWNTCGSHAESMSDECECTLKGTESPWFVHSSEHRNCFWRWIADRSLPNGEMKALYQHEIAELEGCSPTKVHFTIKEAVEKLKKSAYLPYIVEGSIHAEDDSHHDSAVGYPDQGFDSIFNPGDSDPDSED